MNHVFVDFENVKQIDPVVLGRRNLALRVFLGPQNKKLDVEWVASLLEQKEVKLIRSPKMGKNALDFVLAYHLGQAVLEKPDGIYHLISRDEGFDSLVEWLTQTGVKIQRHPDWAALDDVLPLDPESPLVAAIVKQVQRKPRKATKKSAKRKAAKKSLSKQGLSAGAMTVLDRLTKAPLNRPKTRQALLNQSLNYLGKSSNAEEAGAVVDELSKAGKLVFAESGGVDYHL
ncbi:hypothetical protein HNR46_000484 [Haloferula luteola]|uniref:PIN-like domain-containing protein n=1 Tax=Haloferula luteola TaxID=595692 RepID=A0A840V8I2_9BACT|nr:PIN domain-containing protein [Haloferula luteola]MBB5350260.1 hypothetical protein [Haloferula luteola]